MKYFIEIQKSYSNTKGKFLKGVATGTLIDSQGDRMSINVLTRFKESLPLPLVDAHMKDGVFKDLGEVIEAEIKQIDGKNFELEIKAKLDEDNMAAIQLFNNIRKGKRYGFSITGQNPTVKTVYDGEGFYDEITDLEPIDISVTTMPAYETSLIQAVQKSLIDEMNKSEGGGYTDYPEEASENAKKVVEWKKKYGDEIKGMTRLGWIQTNQLAKKSPLTTKTVQRIAAFATHQKNVKLSDKFAETPWKDRGYVAWLGCGGTAGIDWAKQKIRDIDKTIESTGMILAMDKKNKDNPLIEEPKTEAQSLQKDEKVEEAQSTKETQPTLTLELLDERLSRIEEIVKKITSSDEKKLKKSREKSDEINQKLQELSQITKSIHADIEILKTLPLQKKSKAITIQKSVESRKLDFDKIEDENERFKAKFLHLKDN